ncbi:host specificity protein J, partial [Salmonella enterica]|nr:host specificity protein J [Salmonella enterica]
VPEKESIVDNGAHFDPLPGTTNGIIPPAVQHLVVDTDNDSILYQAKAKWDTPRVVKGVRFVVRLTTGSGKEGDPVRLVTTATTSETEYAFHELPLGDYTLTVRAINGFGQQGEPASVAFSIQAPEAPSTIEMTPGYFQITVTPYQAIYDASVQYEFWYSATQLATAADIQSKAQYLGTGSFWIKDNIRPGHDAWFYVRSVNRGGKSAFAEASGQCSDDAEGYLAFFDGKIQQTQLAKELLDKMDNTALKQDIADISKIVSETKNEIEQTVNKTLGDQSATISQIQKVQTDTDNNLNALYMLKVQKTKDGVPYVAGIGAGIEDVAGQTLSQILLAANRTAIIDPSDGNTVPMLVAQGGQIFLNEALVKYLIAPTITSGGDPPAFSLTPDGKLTAKNADISGHINAVSGSFTGEINATSGKFSGVIEAKEFVGDICGSKVMQGVSIRATNDERSTSTRYTDSATYQIGKTITVMANCERNGGSGAITVTININGQVKTAEVMPYTAGIPAMYQTVVFSVHTTSPVVDISVSLRVGGQYTTEASVWPLVMVSRSGNNFTN